MPTDHDTLAIQTIRGLSMDAVQKANSGHPGTPMALAPLGWAIFEKLRKHNPKNPDWFDRDRFVLSCGHASMLQYSLLHLSGYDVSLDDIKAFRQWGSNTAGHPEVGHTPGVEITTGPLGQGFATAVGMAMAERQLAARFNKPDHELIDHKTWVIASDGDLMEGIAAEAASLAGHLKLGKLIVFWDDNEITIDGRTDISFTEDVLKRHEAYGWHVLTVTDGNDLNAIIDAAEKAAADPRPSLVCVKTIIGYPAPNKQDTSSAHGSPLGEDEIALAKEAMSWPSEPFYVPAELADAKHAIIDRGVELEARWNAELDGYKAAFPDDAAELEARTSSERRAFSGELPSFEVGTKMATRNASGTVLTAIAKELTELVGGSADLAGSNKSYLKGEPDFGAEPTDRAPRNVHWGIREHAMAAACNGMDLHGGVVPYGATFLVFSDYMRPAIRLGSLMGCRPRYIFTHDSIGLGEDGPTHQPVEHLAALRAIPGVAVFRPADANEVGPCWLEALAWNGPAALVFTRQKLIIQESTAARAAEGVKRGAYALNDVDAPDVVIAATGSEVEIAIDAAATLNASGTKARVVSVPCWETFFTQDASYRSGLFPSSAKKVVVEAGLRMGWERVVGGNAEFVTLEHFGASAPYETLYREFGLTAERVVELARK